MPDVKDARRKLTLVLIVLFCLDIVCGVILISPIGRSVRSGQSRLQQLWTVLQSKTRETAPLQGIDQKVKDANLEIQQFYAGRLPERYANIIDELGKVAAGNNVKIANAKYKAEETEIPGLRRILIDATLSGDYKQEARFINAMERDKIFFIIDSVTLAEQEQPGQQQPGRNGGVRLQIRLETYMRNEAAA